MYTQDMSVLQIIKCKYSRGRKRSEKIISPDICTVVIFYGDEELRADSKIRKTIFNFLLYILIKPVCMAC